MNWKVGGGASQKEDVANPETYNVAPEAKVNLTAAEEKQFQSDIRSSDWYKEFKKDYGEEPNLNDSNYNYRAAWKAGVKPQRYEFDKKLHWESTSPSGESLKSVSHPTAWMEDYMRLTGSDPHQPVQMNEQQKAAMKRVLKQRYGKGS